MSEPQNRPRPRTRAEALELAKNFRKIPTTLTEPKPPPKELPPEEYQKAEAEYEQKMKQYWLESLYGANYEENPIYQWREPYWDNEWEAIKDLIL
ncbi:MAG TPA: hypothetical protein PLS24_03560 [Sedimentisphaerales bacterium]|nr:hypothetical protein [Thermogutta sp.]HOV77078.1 hypothetical protein [Sedimentisphaerales bacterium]HPZ81781.1 hypothetical protein [Thermogutta sp.]